MKNSNSEALDVPIKNNIESVNVVPLSSKLEFQSLPVKSFPVNDPDIRVTHIGCVHTVLIGVLEPLPKGGM